MYTSVYSVDERTSYLALGAVKNISLNISISNIGDDAYDTNVFFNFSRELFFIKMWQKVRKANLPENRLLVVLPIYYKYVESKLRLGINSHNSNEHHRFMPLCFRPDLVQGSLHKPSLLWI